MSFPDITPELKTGLPQLGGRLLANQPLGEFTWFRVGGPAQAFFMPQDENDLAYFLRNLPAEIAVTVIGAGSNLIVRDGGVPGVVIRLGHGFNETKIEDGHRVAADRAHGGLDPGGGVLHRQQHVVAHVLLLGDQLLVQRPHLPRVGGRQGLFDQQDDGVGLAHGREPSGASTWPRS